MSEGEDGKACARLIAINPKLREENQNLAEFLARRADPIGDVELMAILLKHAAAFGVTAKSDQEWASLFEVYLESLVKLPLESVREAFRRWSECEMYPNDPERHRFYPKHTELWHLAQPSYLTIRKALYRARLALETTEKVTERPPPSEEEKAKIAHMRREFESQIKAPKVMPDAPVIDPDAKPSALYRQLMRDGMRGSAQISTVCDDSNVNGDFIL